jgi:glycosyltransferase involved in cell wall biosynthesis
MIMSTSSLPVVSVITIVYNGEKHIEDAIKSVIDQSYPNIEYIVVDGASKDGTVSIIKKYEQSIHTWVSEPDKGISDAFNKGLRLATGEIIGMINADDWYEQDAVEKAVHAIEGYDIVYGDLRLWKEGKVDFVLRGDHHYLRNEMTINHPTVFVRKKCYDQFGVFDSSYKCAMDYDLMLRLMENNCRFNYVPATISNMRWDGLSDKRWLLGCKETLKIKNKYLPQQKLKNRLYFYKHVLANFLPRLFKKLKLEGLIKMYRSRFSKVRKVYE